ncbi:MAG: S41 family peptidase [Bacteroides sp.]|nr:S41 family peptidase [Bacteroides sp.]MCM1086131.1 S41 family peptidase [Bacteroides sp.]
MNQERNPFYTWIAVALVFVLGLLAGAVAMQKRIGGIRPVINYVQGSKIDAVMRLIDANYVDTVDNEKLVTAGLDAILHSLDPHSVYLPPQDFSKAEEEIQGNFQGIGVQFRMINDTVTVIMPVSGGPSEKVGVQPGDRIIVAGNDTISGKKMSTDQVIKHLKGPKGTKVRLGLQRAQSPALVWVEVRRDVIPTYSVDVHFVVEPGIGYVKVSKFSATTAREFDKAMRDLASRGVSKVMIDLRSNGGGLLSSCIDMADMFLQADDAIVYTEGRNRRRTQINAGGNGKYRDMEVVVLIDEWSASASEIFAGAMQDNDRGMIVGRRSFGKGLVQEQMDMSDGSALRLTVARYYTPSGRCIQKPYAGGYEAYEEDMLQRYLNGEMTGTDSLSRTDTVKYYTKGGRVVYGGGGIEPDVVLPYKTDSLFVYQNRLSNGGYNYDFSFAYTNRNRARLKAEYPSAEIFTQKFELSDALFEEFLAYTEKKGLARDRASIAKYGNNMRLTLKALIGRDLYDDLGFYPTYLQRDDDFTEALKLMKNPIEL